MTAYSQKRLRTFVVATVLAIGLGGCAGAGEKTGVYVDDATITTKVKSAFATDKTVSATKVGVETTHGNVRLSGTVTSDVEKRRAEELARTVAGVRSVSNAIVVQR